MFVVAFAYAGTDPGTVVVHFLDADSADVAVAGSGRTIDVAGHAEFDEVDFESFWDDVGDGYVISDLLVTRYLQEGVFCFVFFVLSERRVTIF